MYKEYAPNGGALNIYINEDGHISIHNTVLIVENREKLIYIYRSSDDGKYYSLYEEVE